ncbi:MAG: TlpA disulfide reductase family protein [Verrucomicrobia bacterium]|nr:TlpA disulfide reductase family protein [Verrucomicrobiota bacterium]
MKSLLLSFSFLTGHMLSVTAQETARPGILDRPAPAWGVIEWLNLPKGKTSLDLADYQGKVVYVYAFQSWCPGCHQHGFPTLKEIIARYGSDTNVAIVAVQTTFEGFQSNGFEQAKQIAKRYDLKIPVGQSGSEETPSLFMRRYRTGGTPWTIIVDREGIVRFNDFHIETEAAGRLINRLKQSPARSSKETKLE